MLTRPNRRPHVEQRPSKPAGERPALEMAHLPVFRVHYEKLEEFVKKVYRTSEFDFLHAAGVTHGMIPEFIVKGVIPDSREWQQRVGQIRDGRRINRYPELVLELLVKDGHIPAGKYIIDTRKAIPPLTQYRDLLTRTRDPSSPHCIAFRKAHERDRAFTEKAAVLDQAVKEDRFEAVA